MVVRDSDAIRGKGLGSPAVSTRRDSLSERGFVMDDLSLFLDHWVIVQRDGTPILNGTPEQFESDLRELLLNLNEEGFGYER